MVDFMYSSWKLYRPKIIISITGGAKNFDVKSNLKNSLKKGIVKAALSTNAWLITGGTNEGIMRLIGESVKEQTLDPETKLVVLGLVNWTTILNNHQLIRNVCLV
jgi:transient receptor potential cation channel subfamily M protein 2